MLRAMTKRSITTHIKVTVSRFPLLTKNRALEMAFNDRASVIALPCQFSSTVSSLLGEEMPLNSNPPPPSRRMRQETYQFQPLLTHRRSAPGEKNGCQGMLKAGAVG